MSVRPAPNAVSLNTAVLGAGLSACMLLAFIGCSRSSGPAAGNTELAPAKPERATASCEAQALTIKDVSGILVAPIIGTKTVPGDAQSCEYLTGGFSAIIVSVRPGLGKSSVEAWIAGRMPLSANPLPGVGDAAAWQATLHEVIAQKRNTLCDVQLRGGTTDIAISVDSLPGALGALCNRIFAAG